MRVTSVPQTHLLNAWCASSKSVNTENNSKSENHCWLKPFDVHTVIYSVRRRRRIGHFKAVEIMPELCTGTTGQRLQNLSGHAGRQTDSLSHRYISGCVRQQLSKAKPLFFNQLLHEVQFTTIHVKKSPSNGLRFIKTPAICRSTFPANVIKTSYRIKSTTLARKSRSETKNKPYTCTYTWRRTTSHILCINIFDWEHWKWDEECWAHYPY